MLRGFQSSFLSKLASKAHFGARVGREMPETHVAAVKRPSIQRVRELGLERENSLDLLVALDEVVEQLPQVPIRHTLARRA